jgi:Bacterial aa3 type cytochrome c oxidase subunit IV
LTRRLPGKRALLYSRAIGAVFPGDFMAKGKEQGSMGTTDITQSRQTWKGFLTVIKWSLTAILLILAFMAIFRVH